MPLLKTMLLIFRKLDPNEYSLPKNGTEEGFGHFKQ
jgi:hypothetical protein